MFTLEQIDQLLANKNVSKCSSKSITYKKEFKIWAVNKYFNGGYSPNMIFDEAGFDIDMIGRDKPKSCLGRWRRTHALKGEGALLKENRGGLGRRKKQPQFKDKDEEIKYLKAKITYMDAENDFLAKLRGLKRE